MRLVPCDDDVCDDIINFFWGDTDDNLDEEELIKAAVARSLEQDIHPIDGVKLKESLEHFQKQVKEQETCEVLILRKKLLQTCLTAEITLVITNCTPTTRS
jgi:hypothetical protein